MRGWEAGQGREEIRAGRGGSFLLTSATASEESSPRPERSCASACNRRRRMSLLWAPGAEVLAPPAIRANFPLQSRHCSHFSQHALHSSLRILFTHLSACCSLDSPHAVHTSLDMLFTSLHMTSTPLSTCCSHLSPHSVPSSLSMLFKSLFTYCAHLHHVLLTPLHIVCTSLTTSSSHLSTCCSHLHSSAVQPSSSHLSPQSVHISNLLIFQHPEICTP